ncbi:hypothetical protein J7643_19235 [bacterium]|nr:hypothetical protein [bacterium]
MIENDIAVPKWKEGVQISPPGWAEKVAIEPHTLGSGYNAYQYQGCPASQNVTDTPIGHELHAVLAHIHNESLGASHPKLAGYDRAAAILEFNAYGQEAGSHCYTGYLNGTRLVANIVWWDVPDYRSVWPLRVYRVSSIGQGEWAYDSDRCLIWPWGQDGRYTKRTKAKKVIQFSELTA